MTRRDFVKSTAAFAGIGMGTATAEEKSGELKVGVLSDVHVTRDEDSGDFQKALRRFDAERVDAVLIAGDLATRGGVAELEALARAWYKVFPDDKRSDGVRVERLWITGNHDVDGFSYNCKTIEEAREKAFFFRREETWKRLFNEEYKPVEVKTVKGYVFILQNWMSVLGNEKHLPLAKGFGNERSPFPEMMPTIKLPEGRPFFYVQHQHMDNTANASWLLGGLKSMNGQDNGEAKAVLNAYPNCVALTGHSHMSLTDEKSIWQGEFTVVNCSCARGWAFTPAGRENGFSVCDFNRRPVMEMPRIDNQSVRQAMIMTVSEKEIRFHRFELVHDQVLGPDWVVPLYGGSTIPPSGKPKYDFAARKAASKPPRFASGAKVTVKRIKDGRRRDEKGINPAKETCEQVVASFPPITTASGSPSRGYDFTVRCEVRDADTLRCVDERRVFSPNMMQGEAMDVEPCTCAFPGEQIPCNREVRFIVTPYDCWGNAGEAISSAWMKV